ncbi:MAG: sulfite exporter TauE/SafE family protein [Firmicutes bacterium]|nr:sulfite exporter TauE/SafE family protein [Bacillota bacterium]
MSLAAVTGAILLLLGASIAAGILGAMLGLGGGVLLVPVLTLLFHINLRLAIGASIISVIATSSGAAVAYVRDGLTNLRIGMFLEIATTTGAVMGAYLAGIIPARWLYLLFGLMLAYSAWALVRNRGVELPELDRSHPLARRLRFPSFYYDHALRRTVHYEVANPYGGLGMMWLAGLISGLLGIGSGLFKVLAMDTIMKLPMKVSTATSNFMIGVTAAASAGVYFARGDIRPLIAAPVAIGVLIGATVGVRWMVRLRNRTLRYAFFPVLSAVALEMLIRGI